MSTTYEAAEAFPPGEYLRDELEERGWTVTEFAEILDRPLQAISEILNGKKEITVETALDIASALGTSAELWLNLQTSYRLHTARSDSTKSSDVNRRSRLRAFGPTAEMRRRGWLPDTDDLDVLEEATRATFRVSTLDESPQFAIAARRSNTAEPLSDLQLAWLGRVRQIAEERPTSPFKIEAVADLAARLPRLLRDGPTALETLPALLRDVGVVLVIEPGLKGSKLDGASFFLESGTAVVALTGRYDRFDSLIFTLLHELAHLVLGHVTATGPFLVDEDIDEGKGAQSAEAVSEREANDQAANWIFPGGLDFSGSPSVAAISRVASDFDVHPSLVVGRLQRDGVISWSRFRTQIPRFRDKLEGVGL